MKLVLFCILILTQKLKKEAILFYINLYLVTGATFIIFDGALKATDSGGNAFSVNVVEDGVIIRLTTDSMENLIKNLLMGKNFSLSCNNMVLNVVFEDDTSSFDNCQGALVSPIDAKSLLVIFLKMIYKLFLLFFLLTLFCNRKVKKMW